MIYNYHTHTYHCRHASGTPEEYILRAVANGIKYMGFSEHMPFRFPDGYESSYRLPTAETAAYFAELTALRKKYENQIDIKIGFEMEYYPTYFHQMLEYAAASGAEYLILGQHFLYEEHPNGIHSTNSSMLKPEDLPEYVSCVVAAIQSKVFTYVAHPDLFSPIVEASFYRKEMRKICAASRECSVPLEINFLGIRDNRSYPHEPFWELAGEEQSPVTFGFDAHDVLNAYDAASLEKAQELVEKYNLNYIGMPEIINISR